MREKKIVSIAIGLILMFSLAVSAQNVSNDTEKKSIKELKNTLSKNSRFGSDIIYWFKPVSFESCQVTFRFTRLGETGLESFATVVFDKSSGVNRNDTIRNSELPVMPAQTNQGQNTVSNNSNINQSQVNGRSRTFNYNSRPYAFYGFANRIEIMSLFVTGIDLAGINPDSIRVEKNEQGQYFVVYESVKDANAIIKSITNGSKLESVDSDIIPVTGEKSGKKISEKFVQAVKACQQ